MYKIYRVITFFLLSTFIFSYPEEWDLDGDGYFDYITDYQYNGSITSAVFLDGVNAGSEGDALAAFVNGEQRGFQGNFAVPFGPYAGTEMFPILIYSNESSGETVEFKFYDAETDLVYNITETFDFVVDMTLGDYFAPQLLNTG